MPGQAFGIQEHHNATSGRRAAAALTGAVSFAAALLCYSTLSLEATVLWTDAVVAVVASEFTLGAAILFDFARRGRWRPREFVIAAAAAVAVVTLTVFWVTHKLAHPGWEGILEIH